MCSSSSRKGYSVVIPAFNAALTLDKTLASVAAQTLRPLEVLVIDDCSTDNTAAVALEWEKRFSELGVHFRVLTQPSNQGPSAARNRGIIESSGEYIALLDADDMWLADKLEIIERFIHKSNPGIIFHSFSHTLAPQPEPAGAGSTFTSSVSIWRLVLKNTVSTSCAVIRRDTQWLFDEEMRFCEDFDLWLRIGEVAPIVYLHGAALTQLGRAPHSAGGLSSNLWRMRLGEIRTYYKFCSRAWAQRVLALPLLISLSLIKHLFRKIFR